MSHSTHCGFNFPPTGADTWSVVLLSVDVGVAHVSDALASSGRPFDDPPAIDLNPCLAVVFVGVGSKAPPPIPFVRGSAIRRTKDSVSPGISSRHKFPDDG